MLYELMLKSGYSLTDKVETKAVEIGTERANYYKINSGELVIVLDQAQPLLIEHLIAEKPQKVIALDKLFSGQDQLKTNTVLQMKDAGIDFRTI